jgi:hypothetical protein
MTLAVPSDSTVALSATVNLIQETARNLQAAHQIAVALVQTPFVPAHFKNKPEDAAAAILYGASIGMDPVTSLQQVYVISGRPALYARAMVAIVLAHGHEVWTESESDGTVTVCGRRRGTANVERVTWTSALAAKAGYSSNKKYQTDPRSMLYARASGDVARRIAPDALLGMAYSIEEMELTGEDTYAAPERSGLNRLREAVPEAPPEPPAPAEPEAMITAAQLRKLHAVLTAAKLTEREAGLAAISTIVSRDIDSSKELTKAEREAAASPASPADDAEIVQGDGPTAEDIAALNAETTPDDQFDAGR